MAFPHQCIIIILKNFVSNIGFILLSLTTLIEICELFIVKKCMGQIASRFSENDFSF